MSGKHPCNKDVAVKLAALSIQVCYKDLIDLIDELIGVE